MVTNEFRLSMTPQFNTQVVWVSQYDTGARVLKFNLYANGAPLTIPSGTTAVINGVKPDGTVYSYPMTVGDSYVQIELQEQMTAVAGAVTAEIVLTGTGGNIGTANFTMMVERSPLDEGVLSESEISAIQQAVDQAQEVLDSIPADYTTLSNDVTGLKSAMRFFGKHELDLTFSAGFIRYDTLALSSGGTHQISDVLYIPPLSVLHIPKISKSNSTSLLTLCESDGTPKQCLLRGTTAANSDGSYLKYPFVNGEYVRIAGNTALSQYMHYYIEPLNYDLVINENNYTEFDPYDTVTYGVGWLTDTGFGTQNTESYKYTPLIVVPKGMTIELWSAGSSALVSLGEYAWNFTIKEPIIHGDSGIEHFTYTADKHMLIRTSARIAPMTVGNSVVLPEDKFFSWKIYYKGTHFESLKNAPIYGKKLTVMGDSLISGNTLKTGVTWVTGICIKYNMSYTNLGVNGNPVARIDDETVTSMVDRTDDVPLDTEYFVLLGGANDKRFDVPLGTIDSVDPSTFYGAINLIVSNVRSRCPKTKMLLMSTYKRYDSVNSINLSDLDYANAMIEAGRHNSIPVFDNYHNSGVDFTDSVMLTWIDESRNKQQLVDGEIEYSSDTHHFSLEGYEWIQSVYENALKGL